jgi:selenocysteine-specific elongation factor
LAESVSQNGYIILGTAGHIDHGKTTLVKALTGQDTDRMKEEKERGISIDIGFAPFLLPDGRKIGLIDVPGHEKFIRNMLAGAGGIDFILLVIDVNEGIMPQTKEHLHILEMLQVRKGIVVLTKADTVEEDWVEMVREEVREQLAGTFLATAPIIAVSAVTGKGMDLLRQTIAKMAGEVQPREVKAPLRMPVDRVFSVPGFGTVVTGTIVAGKVRVGQTVELLPSREKTRVRSIQVHGETVEEAQAGQRTAINLSAVEKSQVERGFVVAQPGIYTPTEMIDARIHVLKDSPWTLVHRMRIRLYLGTSEVLGRVALLDKEELKPGDEGLAQIRLEGPLVCEAKDRFILRSYSPMWTMGGGIVIDAHPARLHRRFRPQVIKALLEKEKGGPEEHLLQVLADEPGIAKGELVKRMKSTDDQVDVLLARMQSAGKVIHLPLSEGYIAAQTLEELLEQIAGRIRSHYKNNPYTAFVSKAQVYSQLDRKYRQKVYDDALRIGEERGLFEVRGDRLKIRDYEVVLPPAEELLAKAVLHLFEEAGWTPPSPDEVARKVSASPKTVRALIDYLAEQGLLVEIREEMFLARRALERAHEEVRRRYETGGPFTVASFRDWLGISRKYALAILEYFDEIKLTKRVEDQRIYTGNVTNF